MAEYEALLPGESGQAASIRNLGDSQTDGEWEKIYVKEARLSAGLCATDGTSLVSASELRAHLDNHPADSTGGSTSFVALTDTPKNFSGAGGMFAMVKADESGLEFTPPPASGTGGTSNHGLLLGLDDDDHPQYFNQTRGDARYAEVTHTHGSASLDLSSKANVVHSHTLSEIPDAGTAAAKNTGGAHGLAELDENGLVLSSQLPGSYDEIVEVANFISLPANGEASRIYITLDTNKQYRWTGSSYSELSPSLALGVTAQSAHRGDHGAAAYSHSLQTSGNPHNLGAADIGAAAANHALNHAIGGSDSIAIEQAQVVDLEAALNAKAALTHEHDALYLAKTNTGNFTPTADYQPATKKYVDDNLSAGGAANFATSGNMLINPDFKINQRGFSGGEIAAGEYSVDRWGAPAGGASAIFTNGAVTLNSGRLRQVCEYAVDAGDKLVFSFYAYNAAFAIELHSCDEHGNVLASSGQKTIVTGAGKFCQYVFTAPAAGETVAVDIIKTSQSSPIVSKLDLRFGETPPAVWQAPSVEKEVQACNYYYRVMDHLTLLGFQHDFWRIYASIRLAPMRVKPATNLLGMDTSRPIGGGIISGDAGEVVDVRLYHSSFSPHRDFDCTILVAAPELPVWHLARTVIDTAIFDAEFALI